MMRTILALFFLSFFLAASHEQAQAQTQPTYKLGSTEYFYGQTYSSTGQPKVKRSPAVRQEFLRSQGYDKTPYGYEVDHIVPLHKGGADATWNMQLLPKDLHRQKTARERSSNFPTFKW